ncbi:MAG: tetratricopeptide repeat protein [Rhodothermales bacterium]|nr:tetratricopeptide repeat protein [Rhodothermales bacterium]
MKRQFGNRMINGMNSGIRWAAGLTLVVVLAASGCAREKAEDLTRTERLRLKIDPRVGAYMARSQAALEQGNFNLALALTDSVLAVEPVLADPHFLRGRIFSLLNLPEQALASYQTVLELDPQYRGAWYDMGLIAFRGGRLREAVEFLQNEELVEPTDFLYLELGKVYARLGEPDSSRIAYEKAIELNPSNASAHMWLGQLMEETGDLDAALAHSLEGARIKPGDHEYEYIIGSLYFRMGDNAKAIEYLKPAADALPWHQGAHYNLGQALLRTGRDAEARPHLARADEAQQMQQAVNDAQSAVQTEPENRDKWVHLSDVQWKVEQYQKAIDAYSVALSLDPANFAMQTNLANMLVQSGDIEAGISRYQSILRIRPEMIDTWLNLGVAYANAGQHANARATWEKGLEYDPQNRQLKKNLTDLSALEAKQ